MKKLHLLLLPVLAFVSFLTTSCGGDTPGADDPVITTYNANLSVQIAGRTYAPAEAVTYTVKSYSQDGLNKIDIVVPGYTLTGTPMGDMTIGGYTVTGICQIPGKTAYSKDYSADGLSMSFTYTVGGQTKTGTYKLNVDNAEAITAIISGTDIEITNCFQPEGMPMQIISTFDTNPED